MVKKRCIAAVVLLLVGVAFGTSWLASPAKAGSMQTQQDWSRVTIVTYASGLTGFFDPKVGRLYVYDSDLENCFIIRELSELGEPLKRLRN